MNFVEPIRDKNKVENICRYLKNTNKRNHILFLTGIYTALRISDILLLKNKDAKKLQINIREKKTAKQRIIEVNPVLKKELISYTEDKDPDDYLIKSRQGYNRPIDRSTAYKILRELGDKFGLENIGTHTLRKTFGYHFYIQTKDLYTLQLILNHSDPSYVLRYIGVEQEEMNKAIKNFKIF